MAEMINLTSRNPVKNDGEIVYKNRHFTNREAVSNLLNFIVRGEPGEDVLGWGAIGAGGCWGLDAVIKQFLYVQSFFHIESRRGKRVYHEQLSLDSTDIIGNGWALDRNELMEIASECGQVYFAEGHQVMFSVHWSQKRGFHFHFAVNSVRFFDGRKFRTNKQKRMERENVFNMILMNHQAKIAGRLSEITVPDDNLSGMEDS